MRKHIGQYTHYEHCRSCLSRNLIPFLSLGNVPLAGGFLTSKKQFMHELYYPLEVCFCRDCFLVQTNNVVDKDTLFKNYFYHSSAIKTLGNHFSSVVEMISDQLTHKKNTFVVEIGCNDGFFLKALKEKNVQAVGVDPATNLVDPLIKKGYNIINDYFTQKVSSEIKNKFGKADVIFSSNTLAHIENMHDVLEGIRFLLKPTGILIFEVHYLGSVLKGLQYDMIYHEHQYYFSLIALQNLLKQHKLVVFDIKQIHIHGGSMQYFVQLKTGKRRITKRVKEYVKKERKENFHKIETYIKYGEKIQKIKKELLDIVRRIKEKKQTIAGYGASGRSTVIMNYCELDSSILTYVIDDSPAKQHTFTPGMHIKVVSNTIIKTKRPDYILLFAWAFKKEILPKIKDYIKQGGKVIIPLPMVTIEDEATK